MPVALAGIAEALKWPAIVTGALVGVWLVYTLIGRAAAGRAVATHDLTEEQQTDVAQSRATEVKRESPKTPTALSVSMLRKLQNARDRKSKP